MALRKILVDTDLCAGLAGAEIDDAAALIALIRDPEVEVSHITTVYGNATIETVTDTTKDLLERLGASVGLTQGAQAPLQSQPFVPPWEPHLPQCNANPNTSAAEAIVRCARSEPGLVIVALGPLTNVALALEQDRDVVENVSHLYVMGGNRDPSGEFNFDADPVAAERVLNAVWPITLFGLDVTNQQTFTPRWFGDLPDDPAVAVLKDAAPAWIDEVVRQGWHEGGCALHDAVPAVFISRPEIATIGRLTAEHLAALGVTTGGADLRIADALDGGAFQRRLTDLIGLA